MSEFPKLTGWNFRGNNRKCATTKVYTSEPPSDLWLDLPNRLEVTTFVHIGASELCNKLGNVSTLVPPIYTPTYPISSLEANSTPPQICSEKTQLSYVEFKELFTPTIKPNLWSLIPSLISNTKAICWVWGMRLSYEAKQHGIHHKEISILIHLEGLCVS